MISFSIKSKSINLTCYNNFLLDDIMIFDCKVDKFGN